MGEQGEDANSKESLVSKKPWEKALIFVAGVAMNFALAWVVLTFFYAIGGRAIILSMWEHKGVVNTQKVAVTEILAESPALSSGLQQGDYVTNVNGERIYSSEQLSTKIGQSSGPVTLTVERGAAKSEIKVTPKEEEVAGTKIKRIGIVMENAGKIKTSVWRAPIVAAAETVRVTKLTTVEFGKFLKKVATEGKLSEGVGGPVAIVKVTGAAAALGLAALAQLVVMLSISLGVLNILPFPALDGGHLLFLGIEKLAGREIPKKYKDSINKVGFILLLILIAWITFNDLGRFGILR